MSDGQNIVQRIATKALIINDKGQILILREAGSYDEGTNAGRYHMPGGRLDPGEPFIDGLKREVDEETGLRIEIGKPIYVGEWFPVIKGVHNQIVAIFFICKSLTDNVRLSEEHDEYKWVLPKDASSFDIMSPEDSVIEEYVKSSS